MISTHLKNMLIKLDHFPNRGENKTYLKPPPSKPPCKVTSAEVVVIWPDIKYIIYTYIYIYIYATDCLIVPVPVDVSTVLSWPLLKEKRRSPLNSGDQRYQHRPTCCPRRTPEPGNKTTVTFHSLYEGFLKWWYPTTMGLLKMIMLGCHFGGKTHHLRRKHPNIDIQSHLLRWVSLVFWLVCYFEAPRSISNPQEVDGTGCRLGEKLRLFHRDPFFLECWKW